VSYNVTFSAKDYCRSMRELFINGILFNTISSVLKFIPSNTVGDSNFHLATDGRYSISVIRPHHKRCTCNWISNSYLYQNWHGGVIL